MISKRLNKIGFILLAVFLAVNFLYIIFPGIDYLEQHANHIYVNILGAMVVITYSIFLLFSAVFLVISLVDAIKNRNVRIKGIKGWLIGYFIYAAVFAVGLAKIAFLLPDLYRIAAICVLLVFVLSILLIFLKKKFGRALSVIAIWLGALSMMLFADKLPEFWGRNFWFIIFMILLALAGIWTFYFAASRRVRDTLNFQRTAQQTAKKETARKEAAKKETGDRFLKIMAVISSLYYILLLAAVLPWTSLNGGLFNFIQSIVYNLLWVAIPIAGFFASYKLYKQKKWALIILLALLGVELLLKSVHGSFSTFMILTVLMTAFVVFAMIRGKKQKAGPERRVTEKPAAIGEGPRGIAGWLLVMVILLILNGIIALVAVIFILSEISQIVALSSLVALGLIAYSLVLIFQKKRKAVLLTKAALWYMVFDLLLSSGLLSDDFSMSVRIALNMTIFALLWTMYLDKSKRVRNTLVN